MVTSPLSISLTRKKQHHPQTAQLPLADLDSLASSNISRVLAAAVASRNFRRLFLADLAAALRAGYHGERFHLTAAETALLISTRAMSLQALAASLSQQRRQAVGDGGALGVVYA
jgi:hypothetical protein